MTIPALLQKPLKNVTEVVDDPKVDVRRMKKLTGELQTKPTLEQCSTVQYLKDAAFDFRFFLGLYGRHESSARKPYLRFLLLLLIPLAITICHFGVQKHGDVSHTSQAAETDGRETAQVGGIGNAAAVPAVTSNRPNAEDSGGMATDTALQAPVPQQSILPSPLTIQGHPPVTPAVPDISQPTQVHENSESTDTWKTTGAAKYVEPVGFNRASKPVPPTYKTADEFWRAHPSYSRELYTKEFGKAPPPAVVEYWARRGRPLQ